MSVITKDLGAVTAYAAAVNRGYTGSREEFETLMASYAYVGEQAAESATNAGQSAQSASQSATDAETAKGTAQQAATDAQTAQTSAQGYAQSAQQSAQSASQSATDAESAKNTAVNAVDGFAAGALQALDSVNQAGINWKSLAQAKALDSEAYALGTRNGKDIGSSDPAYHNNAKYYAQQGSASAQTATESAQTATQRASDAQASASAAAESARTLTIDATLTQAGQAADAKVVGDGLIVKKDEVLTLYDTLWSIGGIGSNGENYASRNTSIFTRNYLNLDGIARLVCNDGSLAYVAFYDSEKHFVERNIITTTEVAVKQLPGYDSSAFMRVELANTSINDYEKLKVWRWANSAIEKIDGKIAEISDKNELKLSDVIRGYPTGVSGIITITGTHVCLRYVCSANTKYQIYKKGGDRFWVLYANRFDNTFFDYEIFANTEITEEITTPPNTNYIILYVSTTAPTDIDELIASIHIGFNFAKDSEARARIDNAEYAIERVYSDINDASLWTIGGIGSDGKDFDTRTWGIRTNEYLDVLLGMKLTIKSGYMIRLVQYTKDKVFINRVIYYQTDSLYLADILDKNADKIRIEIECVDESNQEITTPFADTSAYTGLKILTTYRPVDNTFEQDKYIDLISQSRYVYAATDSGVSTHKPLTLLHCSDLHGNFAGMKYVMDIYTKYESEIDAILHTGDVVTANLSDGITNWVASGCANTVLNTIGNHDTEENLVLQAAGKDNVYNTLFAPYISNWGVVQPTGVDDSSSADYHALYYYKDFTTSEVRLIVLDTNFWDSAEKAWLTSVLDDARTNSLCVVIACHNVKKLTEITESNFSAYPGDGIHESGNSYGNQPDDWLDPVQSFIESGGNFACILAGHNHSGHMGTMTNYPDIFVYVADKSSMNRVSGTARLNGELNQNTVSIVTVNPVEKLFKIVKIGAEVDGKMRGRHVFCYDYENKKIISQW